LRRDQQLKEIQKELEVARRIQLSILPVEFPASINFQIAARYVPVTSVAGDFCDYTIADDQQVGLLIADVSGDGVPAALIASMVELAAASQRRVAADPCRFMAGMNSAFWVTRRTSSSQQHISTWTQNRKNCDTRQRRPFVACQEWRRHSN